MKLILDMNINLIKIDNVTHLVNLSGMGHTVEINVD